MLQAHPSVEVLELVLGYLLNAEDLVRCSAVSRDWAGAVNQKQYTSLIIKHACIEFGDKNARKQLKWVQSLQRRQCLRQLSSLQLHSDGAVPRRLSSFLSDGLLVFAGGWRLQSVVLHAPFCFATALDLLPETLLEMDLWPDSGPAIIRLSNFQRFRKLQMLRLAIDDNVSYQGWAEHNFVIDTSADVLTHFAVNGNLHCTLSPDCNIASCLPNICYIVMEIVANNVGLDLAQDMVRTALKKLRWLKLLLHGADLQQTQYLVIPYDSPVEYLHLTGPPNGPLIELKLEKNTIIYDCKHVLRVHVCDMCLPLLSSGLSRLVPEEW